MPSDGNWARRFERDVLERRFGSLPWEESAVVVALRGPGWSDSGEQEAAQWNRLRQKCERIVGAGVIRTRRQGGRRFVAFRAEDADAALSELVARASDYGFEVLRGDVGEL